MRPVLSALALGTFALGCLWQMPAHARGASALLPSTNSSSGGSSLGLVPDAPATSDTTTTTPAPQPTPAPTPLPDVSAAPSGALPYTPVPQASSPTMQMPVIPTQVTKIPVQQPNMSLPHQLAIDIADKYVWSPADVVAVQKRLGIAGPQVPAHCHVAINGMAYSDRGLIQIEYSNPSHTAFSYDGTLSNIKLTTLAMCDLVPLPPNAGYITQYGDKYLARLGQAVCAPPPAGHMHMIFQYGGNGTGQCIYN
jgi:hypothetical protein